MGGVDNRRKNKRETLCCVPKCNNFGGHKFPSEATAKNVWIKWLDEPEKRKLGCRLQFHAVGPRSSLGLTPPKSNFGDCSQWAQLSGPYVGPICLGANKSHIYSNMCAIFGYCPTVVSREKRGGGGYRHTDSWHEWVQDNFYGSSATKQIVIKEPSFTWFVMSYSTPPFVYLEFPHTNRCVYFLCW